MFLAQSNCFHKGFLNRFFNMVVLTTNLSFNLITIVTLPNLTFPPTGGPVLSSKGRTTFCPEDLSSKRSIPIIYLWPLALSLSPQTPCQWKQTHSHKVIRNRIRLSLAITFTHSKKFLTLILPHPKEKSLDIKAFSSTFFSQLVQAVIPPLHDASAGVQSSSGALKHLALKCQSEMFNCVLPINSHILRFAVTVSL